MINSSDAKVKCVGVMITASHNPPQDNGIKIVDSDGGMLTSTWEPYAEEIANVEPSLLAKALQQIGETNGISDLNSINGFVDIQDVYGIIIIAEVLLRFNLHAHM